MYWWTILQQSRDYDFVWNVEYDVRAYGNLGLLWGRESTYGPSIDYISSEPIHPTAENHYWNPTITHIWSKSNERPRTTAWKQMFRVSKNFLNYLDTQFQFGYNAQDELALASHATQGHFVIDSLQRYLATTWTPHPTLSPLAEKDWQRHFGTPFTKKDLQLFHPIKSI
jgi:hypothetical protein